jgi:hypothetical protein
MTFLVKKKLERKQWPPGWKTRGSRRFDWKYIHTGDGSPKIVCTEMSLLNKKPSIHKTEYDNKISYAWILVVRYLFRNIHFHIIRYVKKLFLILIAKFEVGKQHLCFMFQMLGWSHENQYLKTNWKLWTRDTQFHENGFFGKIDSIFVQKFWGLRETESSLHLLRWLWECFRQHKQKQKQTISERILTRYLECGLKTEVLK